MQFRAAYQQIDWNRVVERNLNHLLRRCNFDVFSLRRYVQILNFFVDVVPDLIFRVPVDHRKSRHLIHFAAQLIFRHIGRYHFEGDKDGNRKKGGIANGLYPATTALPSPANRRSTSRGALKFHEILLRAPPTPQPMRGVARQDSTSNTPVTLTPCQRGVEILPRRVFPESHGASGRRKWFLVRDFSRRAQKSRVPQPLFRNIRTCGSRCPARFLLRGSDRSECTALSRAFPL